MCRWCDPTCIHTIYAKQKYQIAKLAYTCKCLIIIDVCIEEFWGSHCADTACCMSTGQTEWWRKGDADCQSAKEPLKIQRSSWCFIFFSAYFTYRPTGQRKCSNMRQRCIWGFGFITFLKQKFTKLTESSSNQFLLWTLCFRNQYILIFMFAVCMQHYQQHPCGRHPASLGINLASLVSRTAA